MKKYPSIKHQIVHSLRLYINDVTYFNNKPWKDNKEWKNLIIPKNETEESTTHNTNGKNRIEVEQVYQKINQVLFN